MIKGIRWCIGATLRGCLLVCVPVCYPCICCLWLWQAALLERLVAAIEADAAAGEEDGNEEAAAEVRSRSRHS